MGPRMSRALFVVLNLGEALSEAGGYKNLNTARDRGLEVAVGGWGAGRGVEKEAHS